MSDNNFSPKPGSPLHFHMSSRASSNHSSSSSNKTHNGYRHAPGSLPQSSSGSSPDPSPDDSKPSFKDIGCMVVMLAAFVLAFLYFTQQNPDKESEPSKQAESPQEDQYVIDPNSPEEIRFREIRDSLYNVTNSASHKHYSESPRHNGTGEYSTGGSYWNDDGYGYDENGYDRDGYDRDGYDEDGYDRDGFDEEGYDEDGIDEEGYDEDGNYEGAY